MGGSKRFPPGGGGGPAPGGQEAPAFDDRQYRDRLLQKQENTGLRINRLNERSSALSQQLAGITGTTPEDIERRQHITDRQARIGGRVEGLTSKSERIAERLKTGDYGPRMAGEAMQNREALTGQDRINAYKILTGGDSLSRYTPRPGFYQGMQEMAKNVEKTGQPYSRDEIEQRIATALHGKKRDR